MCYPSLLEALDIRDLVQRQTYASSRQVAAHLCSSLFANSGKACV